MTNLEIIIFISLAINVFLGIAGLFLSSEIRELRGEMRFFKDLDAQLVKSHEETNRTYDRLMDIYRGQTTMCTGIYEQYTGIYEQYNHLEAAYKEICVEVNKLGEQHRKLLQCWENVEKRYSDAYEQFNHTNKQLGELNPMLKRIINDRTYDRLMDIYRGQSPTVGPAIPDPEYEPVEVTEEKMEKVEEFLKEETAKKPRKSRKKEGSSKDVQAG